MMDCFIDVAQTAILGLILGSQTNAGKKLRSLLIRYRNWRQDASRN